MENNPHYRTALVLQGGGALGAYEYGVMKALYESRPQFKPAVVTGVSIGAINAAVLVGAKEDPIRTLEHVWRHKFTALQALPPPFNSVSEYLLLPEAQKCLALLGNCGMYQLRPEYLYAPLLATSVYDLAPLRETLAKVVDVDKLNRSHETRVVVSAVNVATAELAPFDNQEGFLSLDHIIASGSLPPYFPMTEIAGQYYWDGGLVSSMPLGPAINCLEQCEANDPEGRRELIVVELFPRQAKVPSNMTEVLSRAVQLRFTSKLTLDQRLFAKFNSFIDLIQKIDTVIPPSLREVRDHPAYKELSRRKRKIDAFTSITCNLPLERCNPLDFSKATIAQRIEAGYQDALDQEIGKYHPVPLGMS